MFWIGFWRYIDQKTPFMITFLSWKYYCVIFSYESVHGKLATTLCSTVFPLQRLFNMKECSWRFRNIFNRFPCFQRSKKPFNWNNSRLVMIIFEIYRNYSCDQMATTHGKLLPIKKFTQTNISKWDFFPPNFPLKKTAWKNDSERMSKVLCCIFNTA